MAVSGDRMSRQGWIGVDFDGTLSTYHKTRAGYGEDMNDIERKAWAEQVLLQRIRANSSLILARQARERAAAWMGTTASEIYSESAALDEARAKVASELAVIAEQKAEGREISTMHIQLTELLVLPDALEPASDTHRRIVDIEQKLRRIEKEEAAEHQAAFEAALLMPLDAGARLAQAIAEALHTDDDPVTISVVRSWYRKGDIDTDRLDRYHKQHNDNMANRRVLDPACWVTVWPPVTEIQSLEDEFEWNDETAVRPLPIGLCKLRVMRKREFVLKSDEQQLEP